jgi:hypothetical protein
LFDSSSPATRGATTISTFDTRVASRIAAKSRSASADTLSGFCSIPLPRHIGQSVKCTLSCDGRMR